MTDYRVSVLVTFYNQEKYVDKAMESILSQETDFGVKIIVGDDGSSDRTVELVNGWISRFPDRISLYVMDRIAGNNIPGFRASKNRINILKHVDTEYFIFLDGDDYFDNAHKLQKQVEILDDPANSDCICCGHNTYMLYEDGAKKPATDPSLKEGKIAPDKYWKKHYIHTDSLLFRSSVIAKTDLDLLDNSYNDNMITYAAIMHGNIYYIPEYWAVYVQTNDGIWTSMNRMVNLIRNMIFYDISVKIDPKMRLRSVCRFSYLWKDLYRLRKDIDPDKLTAYAAEAKGKDLKNTSRWIMYRELNVFQKAGLALKVFVIRCVSPVLRRVL